MVFGIIMQFAEAFALKHLCGFLSLNILIVTNLLRFSNYHEEKI